ncbi:MAG: hypothetical protein WAO23_02530 [Dethiobacteria bacterium]
MTAIDREVPVIAGERSSVFLLLAVCRKAEGYLISRALYLRVHLRRMRGRLR